jgi:hypothetical protein
MRESDNKMLTTQTRYQDGYQGALYTEATPTQFNWDQRLQEPVPRSSLPTHNWLPI